MKVVEIFNSIEGEGKRAGMPCTFIRLHGCNLACSYCDTRYACTDDSLYYVMSVDEIIKQVQQWDCKVITITGGEPLIHPGISKLINALITYNYCVNIETNGTQELLWRHPNLFYTVDYKSLSSGMSDKMNPETFKHLSPRDVLKFVVGTQEDLDQALQVTEMYKLPCHIYVSPVYGQIEAKHIVEYIQMHHLWDWRVQLQLHKYIFDPNARGV